MFRGVVRNWPGTLQITTGALLIALGSIVIIGWYTGSARLLQISPSFVAMQYNTALCFLLFGIALVYLNFGIKRIPMFFGLSCIGFCGSNA